MSIDEILDEMDELLDKASSVPFAQHKKIIDGERMRELINDVRLNMPHEMKEAKKIEFDCQRILNEAKLNAEAIIRKAEDRAAQIVSREAIVNEAKKKAIDMLTKAQTASRNLQQNAAVSVTRMLSDTENYYAKNLQNIKAVKTRINTAFAASGVQSVQPQPQPKQESPQPVQKPANYNPNK